VKAVEPAKLEAAVDAYIGAASGPESPLNGLDGPRWINWSTVSRKRLRLSSKRADDTVSQFHRRRSWCIQRADHARPVEWHAFSVRELHRFANGGVRAGDGYYWDILGIWSQIKAGLTKYHSLCRSRRGRCCDAWGVDFGLLDNAGHLIGNPRHYRDPRTVGIPQLAFETVSEREWFSDTVFARCPSIRCFSSSAWFALRIRRLIRLQRC